MNISKSRGRPRKFDRTQALERALELFWKKGFEGTSLTDLTSKLNINAPSLYAAFESKPALYCESLELYLRHQLDDLHAILDTTQTAKMAIEAILRLAAERFSHQGGPFGCPVASGVLRYDESNRSIGEFTAEHRRRARSMILERLQQGQKDGDLSLKTDLYALAGFYASTIQGMSVQAIDGADTTDLHKIVDIAMDAWPNRP